MGKTIHKYKLTPFAYFDLGINRKYACGGGQLSNLRKWLNSKSLSADYLYNDQSEYLVSIRAYPFWMEKFFDGIGNYEKFAIGPFSANEVNTKGKLISGQKAPILIGEYYVARKYNNFMDYAPYTKITAYIPYISFVSLNVNEIMGKTIKFYAQVDFDNGLLQVWLECDNTVIDAWETVIGVEINLNRTNGSDWARNMYLWGIKTVTGVGGLIGNASSKGVDYGKSIKTGGDVGTGFIGANQHHVFHGDLGSGVNKLYNPTSIYLIYSREKPVETDYDTVYGNHTFASLHGLPLNKPMWLTQLTGFTKVGEIHLHNFDETLDSELSEIESLLHSGVIL